MVSAMMVPSLVSKDWCFTWVGGGVIFRGQVGETRKIGVLGGWANRRTDVSGQ